MPFPLAPGFLGGAVFLGAKVRSFSADLSWNTGGPSQLNVQLVDDPADGSLFSPAPLGSPVTFSFGSFTFSGLLQRYEKKRDSSGNPLYDASVVDPREILEGCELVVGGYSGAVTVRNVLSPFGHWESKGFGLSLANESGMPWFRVRDAVSALVNQPTVGSYGGPLHYRGYNYGLDLTEVPVPPDSYRIGGGVTVGLLEAISQVCEDGGHDFFVELSGANIRIRTVSRATQPPLGTMAALADSDYGVSATRISEGLECRNELTAAVLVGGQVTSLHQTAVLTQFWGWDVDGLPIVGAAHVLNFFDKAQPPQLIEAVNTEKMLLNASPVADVVANVRYECTTFEMRLAQANVESWENYITVHRPQIAQGWWRWGRRAAWGRRRRRWGWRWWRRGEPGPSRDAPANAPGATPSPPRPRWFARCARWCRPPRRRATARRAGGRRRCSGAGRGCPRAWRRRSRPGQCLSSRCSGPWARRTPRTRGRPRPPRREGVRG
jgi:hypothetical protein